MGVGHLVGVRELGTWEGGEDVGGPASAPVEPHCGWLARGCVCAWLGAAGTVLAVLRPWQHREDIG